ncbi:divalent-cation tolerance protein CutA [uncultured Rhodoblastus sp.]|uniref:divalent-cation tolerance protein CutA n=1 Tax=uncultured Rhodoblastus sp. TaxID=543037 RepID=UPI0025EBEA12|nr:divalent-cation tolerance protein CutA [uncultured Rhodoblastus sp.]
MDMSACCVVTTTTDRESVAEKIAQALLEKRLAACVQVHQVNSRYVWKGAIERADEWSLSIKARAADFDEIAATIRALHTYETPEIIALPILAGDAAYLEWLAQAVARAKG